jgi:hypothetical protein
MLFRFHKMRGISWQAGEKLDSQVELFSMKVVDWSLSHLIFKLV